MWSGPRNLSTAMMYSFGARADFDIADEPFYAPYLSETGLDHPMRDAILAQHETDPARVAARCALPLGDAPHSYMKHMPHHMLDGFDLGWASGCTHVHLIRHPARVIASYAAKRDTPDLNDIAFVQQVDMFEKTGGLILDGTDIRRDPSGMLQRLCAEIGLPFDPAMLHWPAGPRAQDGVWASHWYGAVHASTGFAPPEGPLPTLPPHLQQLCDQAMPFYRALSARKMPLP